MERMQVLVDTSENTPPRGFPEFNKLQLDPVRSEYMKKLRIEMLDHNEEYLGKHPQVEAILRLIVMEVLCHKPFDVRKFIKELLNSPNLETRVAKVILSKRINLERNHTREYYTHVAEWEQRADINNDSKEDEGLRWPEARPARKETHRDKPTYSHLHYFKEPYWLYPKELMKVADKSGAMESSSIKLADWMAAFLKTDFFQKWGEIPRSKDLCNTAGRKSRRQYTKPKYSNVKRRTKKYISEKSNENNRTVRIKSAYGTNIGKADYSAENKNLILRCPSCRMSVANLYPEMDDVERLLTMPTSNSKRSSVMNRPPRLGMEEVVCELGDHLGSAEGLQVHHDGMRLVDERGRSLEEVHAVLSQNWKSLTPLNTFNNWKFKFSGKEISFVIPTDELKVIFPSKHGEESRKFFYDKEIPEKYRSPEYQVEISRT